MPTYLWKGLNSHGEKRNGTIEAADQSGALNQVKRLRIQNLVIKEKPKALFENVALFQPRITGKDLVVFTRQLSTMIDAGLPLVQSIDILAKQQDKAPFRRILTAIRLDIESGTTFADAMRKHPKAFDALFTNMIEAGETGGILDIILGRLATFKEKSMALKKKVHGAMTYPTVCLIIAILILTIILVFVIPVFEQMFAGMGSALPLPTQIVVNASYFVKTKIHYLLIALGIVVFLTKKIYATQRGELQIDAMILRAPIIGPLARKVAVAKFTRTLSTMLQSGVPILEALNVVAKTAGNKVIERAIFRVSNSISEGRPISEPLEESGVFPNMVVQMTHVGESVGALDDMLAKIADFYDEEVDQAVNNLTAMIEPLLMVFLGGMIGGIVIAMYLPIFSMASHI